MSNKQQDHIKDMEEKLAALKVNHVDSPAQARARKLIKPMFITFGVMFLIIIGIMQSANKVSKAQLVSPNEQASASSGNGFLVLNQFVTSNETTLNQKKP